MWCSRGCLAAPAISDAWLCHVSIVGGARRRGCAAGGVPVFFRGLLGHGVTHPQLAAAERGDHDLDPAAAVLAAQLRAGAHPWAVAREQRDVEGVLDERA